MSGLTHWMFNRGLPSAVELMGFALLARIAWTIVKEGL